jgi:ubiquinone/menaquinone biosynthesis C-methylase UbiE
VTKRHGLIVVCLCLFLSAPLVAQEHGRLFPPTDLGLLEPPDRADWQKPDQIMDALQIAYGDAVADIGAGAGFFTIQLARRVGPTGKVYTTDIQRQMLEAIRRRVLREGLKNVETRQATESDQNLPAGALDAVLIVDTYSEVGDPVAFLRNIARALKPNGRIGVVNYKPGAGGPGPPANVRVACAEATQDARAAGLKVVGHATLPYQYLLVVAPNGSDRRALERPCESR